MGMSQTQLNYANATFRFQQFVVMHYRLFDLTSEIDFFRFRAVSVHIDNTGRLVIL